jgi:hypothetical protein
VGVAALVAKRPRSERRDPLLGDPMRGAIALVLDDLRARDVID